MASRFFTLLKTTLQQALAEKTNLNPLDRCNNAVPLLNEAKSRIFRSIANFKKV